MSSGLILLLVTAALVYFGVAQRVLDRMRLTDRQALLFIALIILGSFFDIPLTRGGAVTINIGGAIIPMALAVWLIATADTGREKLRAVAASAATGAVLYGAIKVLQFEEMHTVIDPIYIFGIVGGLVAYVMGRSRRSAFIAGIFGVVLVDVAHLVEVAVLRIPGGAAIGGAGALDTTVLSGLVAVSLAEIIGETRERIQGGPEQGEDRPEGLKNADFTVPAGNPDEAAEDAGEMHEVPSGDGEKGQDQNG
ncbi:MAG: DUF1614 domain-containing protein [Firmicutes bacterium]|nr:DUF1614 domain-containing protein [Bacillota bacterium]